MYFLLLHILYPDNQVWNNNLTKYEVDITPLNSFKKALDKINFSSYCRGRAFDVKNLGTVSPRAVFVFLEITCIVS